MSTENHRKDVCVYLRRLLRLQSLLEMRSCASQKMMLNMLITKDKFTPSEMLIVTI